MRRRGTEMGSEDKLNWGHLPNLFRRARLEGRDPFLRDLCRKRGEERERRGLFRWGEKGRTLVGVIGVKGRAETRLKIGLDPGRERP